MKILSFDIGIHNFAFIVGTVKEQTFDICFMENKDLLPNVNVNKISLDYGFFQKFHTYLKQHHSLFQKCCVCLIERQLLTKKNYKASTMYHHLVSHFCIFFPHIKVIGFPSKQKYSFHFHSSIYRNRKNMATDFIENVLRNQNDSIALEWFNSYSKKDDIADCILIFLSYLKRHDYISKISET